MRWPVESGLCAMVLSVCSSPCLCTHVHMYTHIHDSQLICDKPTAPCPGEERRRQGRGEEEKGAEGRRREDRGPLVFL